MYIVESYWMAILLCIVTMIAWGSWANTQKLAKNWRFELFYWDFAAGILLFAFLMAVSFGSFGNEGRSFFSDFSQADTKNILLPILGGFVWNLANLLLVAAVAVAGMSVAFSIGTGTGWLLGIFINFYFAPVGNGLILFAGSVFILVAIILTLVTYNKLTKLEKKNSMKGIILSLLVGFIIAWYYRLVAAAITPDFQNPAVGFITPYTGVFLFGVGVFISTFLYNPIFMKKPIEGTPVKMMEYFGGNTKNHLLGLFGGAVWCLALSLSFISSGKAGFAISYGLGNGGTLVAILWGIFVWKEFKDAPKGTNKLLSLMLVFYLMGLASIVYSRYA